jgi:hypothetical protein
MTNPPKLQRPFKSPDERFHTAAYKTQGGRRSTEKPNGASRNSTLAKGTELGRGVLTVRPDSLRIQDKKWKRDKGKEF